MTNLNEILSAQQKTLVFKSDGLGYSVTLDIASIPDSSILALLNYGTRKINDQFNSGKAKHGATQEYFDSLIEAVKNGTLAERKTSGLSADDKGIRSLILDWLKIKCKVPASRVKEVQSLNPVAILDEIFSDKPEEWRDEVLGRFVTKWEAMKAIAQDDDIEID